MASTYITVAIPYVNGAPHLGYAYELVLADIAARARRRLSGGRVRFLGGTDDHSLKNVLAAEAAGLDTRELVAANAGRFVELAGRLEVGFDDFLHTSDDPRHAPAVRRLWEAAGGSGSLYRGTYRGRYCVGCEQFLTPAELVEGQCPEHATTPEMVEEENWFFRLTAYQDRLEDLLSSGRLTVTPEPFRHEVLAFVRSGLSDISVSRSVARARGWGVRVPGDPTQVVYVWFDALANYISALGYGTGDSAYDRWWRRSERIHVIGKGILRFHAVYWPAFLLAAGEPLPDRIHVHPYLTADGAKLSKSSDAGGADPLAVIDRFGIDALRWWFARQVHANADTDFTAASLVAGANGDLASGIANVVSRIAALVHRYRGGATPDRTQPALPGVVVRCTEATAAFADLDPRLGTQLVLDAVAVLNRDLESTAPWRVARQPGAVLDPLLATYWRSAVILAEAVEPVVPDLAGRLKHLLGHDALTLPAPVAAFPRLQSAPTFLRSCALRPRG
ncbi:MAG TPA: methionine--tRNA ligase [Acidimicrobiales bacterium]|nr:methionine--tRNA ligase [Acidimicrobiales bacterium]